MIASVKKLWNDRPLLLIMLLAIAFRLLAVIFAKGFGWIDDHFIVIESSQSWVDGYDYNSWLPGSTGNTGPTGHNLFFPGLHFLIFSFFKIIHLDDPQHKMYIIRLLNASWSLLTVYFGYKLTERLSNKRNARMAGLLLAILFYMPWISVRDLVEMICIPFLVLAIWFIVSRGDHPGKSSAFFLAGLFLGLAFNVRPQTVFFSAGLGLAVSIEGKWKELIVMILGALIPFVLIQGTIDYFIWGKPFVEILGYFKGNMNSATAYITGPWYNYFFTVLGLLLPPVSFMLVFGFIRTWRKYLVIFLPVLAFFAFHSYFPNKQERFIFPILPFIIITGMIGWNEFHERSGFWQRHVRLYKTLWILFWALNLTALPVISTVYSKRARVESMVYLSKYKNIRQLLVADSQDNPELFPLFYLGQWPHIYEELHENGTSDSLIRAVAKRPLDGQPRFILFTGNELKPGTVIKARKSFPFIVYETTIHPGFIDRFMHWLNPINVARKDFIYRNTVFYPEKINR